MLPKWFSENPKVKWNCPQEGVDLNIIVKPDASDWENMFRVPLIPKNELEDNANITEKRLIRAAPSSTITR